MTLGCIILRLLELVSCKAHLSKSGSYFKHDKRIGGVACSLRLFYFILIPPIICLVTLVKSINLFMTLCHFPCVVFLNLVVKEQARLYRTKHNRALNVTAVETANN